MERYEEACSLLSHAGDLLVEFDKAVREARRLLEGHDNEHDIAYYLRSAEAARDEAGQDVDNALSYI